MLLLKGVTLINYSIHEFRLTVFGVCVGVAVIIFGIMLYSLIRHRKVTEHAVAPFHQSLWLEILWALIPFIILIFIAILATKALI